MAPNINETPSTDPPRDEEGLLLDYDVVVVGTGLVESIVASALARAGQTVLHCDGSDYYGQLDAVWTLPYLLEQQPAQPTIVEPGEVDASIVLAPHGASQSLVLHTVETKSDFLVEIGGQVATPFGIGIVKGWTISDNQEYASLEIALCHQRKEGTYASTRVGVPPTCRHDAVALTAFLAQHHAIRPLAQVEAQVLLEQQSRSFALDITPTLLYASGPAVEGLLKSQVSDYVEFKSLEGLLWFRDGRLEPVPCSKADVFSSKLLTPMDKRRLMKFLHLALDYGTAEAQAAEQLDNSNGGEPVQSLNERHLNQGRSLARPQNKAVSTAEMQELGDGMAEGMDFETYLRTKQKLSPKLTALVRFALALEVNMMTSEENTAKSWSLAVGMKSLCQHMQALGRFGSTAFLVPLYGSGELPQAFCRSAAVFGATYLLRRAVRGIVLDDKGKQVTTVVIDGDPNKQEKTKRVKCSHVVVPQQAFQSVTSRTRVLRRISVVRGKPIRDDKEKAIQQRHVVIFPPGSIDGHPNTIHGLLEDEAVNVAPHPPLNTEGCTVVHLTTTIAATDESQVDEGILEKALQALLASGSVSEMDEIFHATFSYGLPGGDAGVNLPSNCHGLHVVNRPEPGIAVDTAFEQARAIFTNICPNEDFLSVAKKVDDEIKERLGDAALREEDEEHRLLQTAYEMIEKPAAQDTIDS